MRCQPKDCNRRSASYGVLTPPRIHRRNPISNPLVMAASVSKNLRNAETDRPMHRTRLRCLQQIIDELTSEVASGTCLSPTECVPFLLNVLELARRQVKQQAVAPHRNAEISCISFCARFRR